MRIIDISNANLDGSYSMLKRIIQHLGITVKIIVEDYNGKLTDEECRSKYNHQFEIYVWDYYLAYFSFKTSYVYGDSLTDFAKDLLLCSKFSEYNKDAFLEFFKA